MSHGVSQSWVMVVVSLRLGGPVIASAHLKATRRPNLGCELSLLSTNIMVFPCFEGLFWY